jgi:predicted HD phosphohydrolase
VTVDELLALLDRGAELHDEPEVDALAHALQCGARLRMQYPDDAELAVAGLVHDIADVAQPDDHRDHSHVGARLVQPLLGPRVAHLVGAHVAAKRYLVATDPSYRAQLSARSIETLTWQGEALDDTEVRRMAAMPDLDAVLAVRRADDAAKDPDGEPPGLETWSGLLTQVAR